MKPVELIAHVDEQHRLHAELPAEIPSGPVKITLQPAIKADEERDWQNLINRAWVEGWSDPREDIYTLEDGKPSHESQ